MTEKDKELERQLIEKYYYDTTNEYLSPRQLRNFGNKYRELGEPFKRIKELKAECEVAWTEVGKLRTEIDAWKGINRNFKQAFFDADTLVDEYLGQVKELEGELTGVRDQLQIATNYVSQLEASRRKLVEELVRYASKSEINLNRQMATDGEYRGYIYWHNSPNEATQSWIKWSEE